ncbi:hypothetical protein ABGB18_46335 [Nonomuraea sp. B12E4]|uniref:hypothetical protein n=1 Tax=Nonomuraea sp. B12E4 TaxID=3153564 RepID=UPI00325D9BD7
MTQGPIEPRSGEWRSLSRGNVLRAMGAFAGPRRRASRSQRDDLNQQGPMRAG